jgi:hypothetical protein
LGTDALSDDEASSVGGALHSGDLDVRLARLIKSCRAASKNYEHEGRKEKQAALVPELLKLVEEKCKDL